VGISLTDVAFGLILKIKDLADYSTVPSSTRNYFVFYEEFQMRKTEWRTGRRADGAFIFPASKPERHSCPEIIQRHLDILK